MKTEEGLLAQEKGVVRSSRGKRTTWRWRVRFLIAAALFIFLFQKVSWAQVWPVWQETDPWAVLAALFLTVFSVGISAYKWRLLLMEPGGVPVGTWHLFRIYLIGLFFNNFLPSGMGGDIARAGLAGKNWGNSRAAASVVAERILAAVGLILPGLFFYFPYREEMGSLAVVVPFMAVGVAVLLGACLFPGWAGWVVGLFKGYPGVSSGLARFLETLAQYRTRPVVLLRVVLWSTAFQGVVILINYALFLGMGVPLSLGTCAVIVPVISALAMLPLSVNGLGLREWGYVTFFASLGVDAATSVAVSLGFFLVVTLVSLAGGVLYLLEK